MPEARRRAAKSRAARMGPTGCELEGPTPMENNSNAETYAVTHSAYAPALAGPRGSAGRLRGLERRLVQLLQCAGAVEVLPCVRTRLEGEREAHRIAEGEV